MELNEHREFIKANTGTGRDGLRRYYFALCDEANAQDRPSSTPQYALARVILDCAEIVYGDLAGIRIGMEADLRIPDLSDGHLGFASERIVRKEPSK